MTADDLEDQLLALVRAPGYRPCKPRLLAKQLALDEDGARDLKRAIKKLVKGGRLSYGANHLVGPPASAAKPVAGGDGYRVTGVFRRTEAGYGFVRPPAVRRVPTARRTFSSPPRKRRTRPAAIPCWCDSRRKSSRHARIPKARSSKSSSGRRTNSSAPTSRWAARPTCKSTASRFRSRSCWAIRAQKRSAERQGRGRDGPLSHARTGRRGSDRRSAGPTRRPGVDTLSIIREFNLPGEFDDDAVEECARSGREVRRKHFVRSHRSHGPGHDHDRSDRRPRL